MTTERCLKSALRSELEVGQKQHKKARAISSIESTKLQPKKSSVRLSTSKLLKCGSYAFIIDVDGLVVPFEAIRLSSSPSCRTRTAARWNLVKWLGLLARPVTHRTLGADSPRYIVSVAAKLFNRPNN